MNPATKGRLLGLVAVITALVLFGVAPQVRATDYTWEGDDGTSPTDWDVGANWDWGTPTRRAISPVMS